MKLITQDKSYEWWFLSGRNSTFGLHQNKFTSHIKIHPIYLSKTETRSLQTLWYHFMYKYSNVDAQHSSR